AGQTVAARQPADATSQGEPSDARVSVSAADGGEAKGLRLVVEFPPSDATFSAGSAPGGVNPDALHPAQINHQAAVAYAVARDVMATAAHRHQQTVGVGKVDRVDHVRDASATGDERRPLVDIGIPDLAGLVVARIAGTEQLAP